MAQPQLPANCVWINGPSLSKSRPKFMIVNENTGIISLGRAACIAQLLHEGIVLAIGNHLGYRIDLSKTIRTHYNQIMML